MFKAFIRVLAQPFEKWFLWALLIVNALGSVYGYYWYHNQLAETPWYYLPFVPDSPLSSTLFSLVLILLLLNKRIPLLELLACLWVIKYGLWAVVINLNAGYIYGQFTWENWLLAFSHLGMAVEGFLFIRHFSFRSWQLGTMALWLFANDFMDYVVNLHPYLFHPAQISLARNLAILLSIFLIVFSYRYRDKSFHY